MRFEIQERRVKAFRQHLGDLGVGVIGNVFNGVTAGKHVLEDGIHTKTERPISDVLPV